MSNFTTKYELGQKVFILHNNTLIQDKVERISIEVVQPYCKLSVCKGTEHFEESNGITIQYCICTQPRDKEKGILTWSYDWFPESKVYLTKEEAIAALQVPQSRT